MAKRYDKGKVTTEASLLWQKGNHHIRRQLLGDEIQSQMHGVEYEELLEKDWYNLHNNDMILITSNVEKLKKPINEFIEKHKDHITGKNVDIGQTEGKDKDNVFRVTNLIAEVIEFENELYSELGVELWGYETRYVHETQLEEFLKGENLSVFIKSDYKGGDIQLILKYKNSIKTDREGTDLESAKSFLVYDIEQELEKLKSNSEYEGSNEEVQNGLSITDRLKNDFSFDWENDDDASAYFSRASAQEIYEYMLKVIIPKFNQAYILEVKMNKEWNIDKYKYLIGKNIVIWGYDVSERTQKIVSVRFSADKELTLEADGPETEGNKFYVKSSDIELFEKGLVVDDVDTKSVSLQLLKPDKNTENKKVDDADLAIGQKVRFKDKSGKAIMNSWLDLSGQTGFVSYVLRRSDGVLKEVYIKLDKGYEILDEWDNQVIFTEIDELIELEDMIEIIKEKNMAKYADLTIEEQIKWLNEYVDRYHKLDNASDFEVDSFHEEGRNFMEGQGLPQFSADELVRELQHMNELKGKELVWVHPDTKKIASNSKASFLVQSVKVVARGANKRDYDVQIIYGPEEGDVNWLSKQEVNKILEGEFGNAHEEASFMLAEKYWGSEYDEAKTPFNDPEKFVEEYEGYLHHKIVVNEKGNRFIIDSLEIQNGLVVLSLQPENDTVLHPEHLELYQDFIDGNVVPGHVGYIGKSYSLVLQEEAKEEIMSEKINQLDYKYYVINPKTKKIETGWEYKEDAEDAAKELVEFGQKDISVHSKKTIKGLDIDPDDNSNWGSSKSNYSIIKESLDFGVTEGEYEQADSDKYLSAYESSGKYSSVIKARLVYYLSHADKHFKQAIMNNQYDKALRFAETKQKIADELLKITKKDM